MQLLVERGFVPYDELLFTVLNDSVISTHETPHALTERRVKIFELVHICLFVLSMIYVIAVVISYFVVRLTWRKWSRIEVMDRSDPNRIERQYRDLKQRFERANILSKVLNVARIVSYLNAIEMYSYYTIKNRFLAVHKLPRSFRFDIYLKTRIRKMFLNLIDLGVDIWASVFIAALINYGRGKVINLHSAGNGLWAFFGLLSVTPMCVCCVVYIFIRAGFSIYQKEHLSKDTVVNSGALSSDLSSGLLRNDASNSGATAADESRHEEHIPEPTLDSLSEVEYDVDMKHYFVFKQPRIIFFIMQAILLSHSFYIAMLIIHFMNVVLNEGIITRNLTVVNVIVYLCLYIPSLIVLFVLFPLIISPFTIMTSVDNFSSHKTILYCVHRAEALMLRAAINKAMNEQPHYHPLRNQLKEMLTEHFPVLNEHGEFHEEPYFLAMSNKQNEHRKQLRNLIFYWNQRAKMLKDAKLKRLSKRNSSIRLVPPITEEDFETNEQVELASDSMERDSIPGDGEPVAPINKTNDAQILDMSMMPQEEYYDDDE